MSTAIRVELPAHLRTLARVKGEVTIQVEGTPTQRTLLDALESAYPPLAGTIRDHTPLPAPVLAGQEPFLVIGAIAGG